MNDITSTMATSNEVSCSDINSNNHNILHYVRYTSPPMGMSSNCEHASRRLICPPPPRPHYTMPLYTIAPSSSEDELISLEINSGRSIIDPPYGTDIFQIDLRPRSRIDGNQESGRCVLTVPTSTSLASIPPHLNLPPHSPNDVRSGDMMIDTGLSMPFAPFPIRLAARPRARSPVIPRNVNREPPTNELCPYPS